MVLHALSSQFPEISTAQNMHVMRNRKPPFKMAVPWEERPEHRVIFCTENFLEPSDPKERPVTIIGQVDHLLQVDFSRIEKYFNGRVSKVRIR